MDDRRIGRILRAVRVERRLRQLDVARLAHVDQKVVSLAERGHLERVSLRRLRQIAGALEVDLVMGAHWRGGEADRLVDRGHAALVEAVARRLDRAGWEVTVEFTFNHFGERGSVDVLAWHAKHRALLLVEAKTTLTDLQAMLGSIGRKRRIVPRLVESERGWQPLVVGSVLAMTDTTTNRLHVRRHERIFQSAFPLRPEDVRRWIRDPTGHLSAIWYVRGPDGATRSSRVGRVRHASPRVGPPRTPQEPDAS